MNRYSRHLNLLGEDVFSKIRKTSILVAGAGGLGSSVLQLLTRIGFGTIHIFDPGIIDDVDLNRQLLYDEKDLGSHKVYVAAEKLKAVNSEINIIAHNMKLNLDTQVSSIDIVVDCLDNFQSRFVLEELFFNKGIPIIHAGVSQFFGQVTSLIPFKTNKLSEIFGEDFLLTSEVFPKDIFPPVVTLLASIQVSEVVKFISGKLDDMLINKMVLVDLLSNSFNVIDLGTEKK